MATTQEAEAASTSAGAAMRDEPIRQVPIKLHTSQATLSIPDVPYLIPTTWQRAQLSTLVNRLLKGEDDEAGRPSVPFDFIIDGQLLRTSVSQYLQSKGLTEESTLDIEYVRSTLPPTFTASFEHDDWISAVDASHSGHFLTSSFDGTLRVFGTSAVDKALLTYQPGHPSAAALTSTCWLTSASSPSSQGALRIASSGMDGALRISRVHLPSAELDGQTLSSSLESVSFTDTFQTPSPLSSVALNAQGDTLVTAGWDGCVAIWDSAEDVDEGKDGAADRNAKRRKGVKGGSVEETQTTTGKKKPLNLFWHVAPTTSGMERVPNSNARVARALWNGSRSVASAGWDGSVRCWDVSAGVCASTKTSDKVILAADAMCGGDHIVTGHMDRSAALWDVRTSASTNIAIAFANAHASPLGVIRAHPKSSHLFVSGAYDGTVKLWDTRSPRAALFSLIRPTSGVGKAETEMAAAAQKKKILALDWDPTGQTVVAGGEDCQLTVHRGNDIGRESIADVL